MQTTPVKTSPAPNPLPPLWERALANSINQQLTRHGWATAKELRAWHPTGAPRTGGHSTAKSIPGQTDTTDLLNVDIYAWGLTDPEVTGLPMPPLAWMLQNLHLAGALDPDQQSALAEWQRAHRNTTPPKVFTRQANRHGQPTLRNSSHVPDEVREAFLVAARTARVVILDPTVIEDAYADALNFNIRRLEATLGV